VQYDYIGKFESFGKDMECILGRLGLWKKYGFIWGDSGKERFPGSPVSGHATHSSKIEVVKGLWTDAEIRRIPDLYRRDFEKFDYSTRLDKLVAT